MTPENHCNYWAVSLDVTASKQDGTGVADAATDAEPTLREWLPWENSPARLAHELNQAVNRHPLQCPGGPAISGANAA